MTTMLDILKDAINEAEEIVGSSVDDQPVVVREKAVEILAQCIDDPELADARDRKSKNLLADCRTARAILTARIANEKAAA